MGKGLGDKRNLLDGWRRHCRQIRPLVDRDIVIAYFVSPLVTSYYNLTLRGPFVGSSPLPEILEVSQG